MDSSKPNVVPVMGYLASNWVDVNEATPAVILNPAANSHDLLAWCWGELQSLQSALNVMSERREAVEVGDISAILVQRIRPLCAVYEIAVQNVISTSPPLAIKTEFPLLNQACSEAKNGSAA